MDAVLDISPVRSTSCCVQRGRRGAVATLFSLPSVRNTKERWCAGVGYIILGRTETTDVHEPIGYAVQQGHSPRPEMPEHTQFKLHATGIIRGGGLSGPRSEGGPTWLSRGCPQMMSPPSRGVARGIVCTRIAGKTMPLHKVRRLWKFRAGGIDDRVRSGSAAAKPCPEPPR